MRSARASVMGRVSQILSGQDRVQDHLLDSFRMVRRLVAPAYGPAGGRVLLDRPGLSPRSLRAGAVIVGALRWQTQPGIDMMSDAMDAIDLDLSNGASTLALLAVEFSICARRAVAAGLPLQEASAILQDFAEHAARSIEAQAVATDPVLEEHLLRNSSGADETFAAEILAAHLDLRDAGGLVVDQAAAPRDEVAVARGFQIPGGLADLRLARKAPMPVEVSDPHLLLLRGELSDLSPVVPVLNRFVQNGRNLVIVADAVQGDALKMLIANRDNPDAVVTAIKGPGQGQWRLPLLQDLADYCGATVIASELGRTLDSLSPSDLGKAGRLTITRDGAFVQEGRGEAARIAQRKAQIRADIAAQKHLAFDRIEHQKRLSRFGHGLATIRLAQSHHFAERRRAVESGVAALRLAQAGGVLATGAAALLHVPKPRSPRSAMARHFADQLHATLRTPLITLLNSCGADVASTLGTFSARPDLGINVLTGQVAADGGAVPAVVMARALRDAASVTGALMAAAAMVQSRPEPRS